MLPQPNTIDSFTQMRSNEAARPVGFRAKLSARHDAAASTLERFDAQPLDTDIDAVLTAQSVKLSAGAMLASFDRLTIESRQKTLADTAAVAHHDIGKGLLENERATRSKGRAAKLATLGKASAAVQEAMFAPDLPHAELVALEAKRADLVGQSEALEFAFAISASAIERFSYGPSAETWHDAVRAVRAVNFT